jgi:GTP-binding protein
MNFIDKVEILVSAGDGGNGRLSFRREKFVEKGGPDGGDAGNGGDVVFIASKSERTLASFRYQKALRAKTGGNGGKAKMHGKNAQNLRVHVPPGTAIFQGQSLHTPIQGLALKADLVEDGQEVVAAKGGSGGYGNAHFTSSTRQAPKFAEKGELGEEFFVTLELKMLADVGLVGLPNAGKSTLLAKISNARPEIADYPFTTITPNVGVVDFGKTSSALFADIPGLIEGAASGKGLGHDFLRHIERTKVLVHLIDAYNQDVANAYQTIFHELASYKINLASRPQIVALTKTEGLSQDIIDEITAGIRKNLPKKTPVLAISAISGKNLPELLGIVQKTLAAQERIKYQQDEEESTPVYTLENDKHGWNVEKTSSGFRVTGTHIEHFAARTDFDNDQAVRRLRDIMQKQGIIHELERQGCQPGQEVQIGNSKIML